MNEETTTILIDTALASGAASALDPEERKVQELVLAIRDDAPAPDPDFALRMDARVAAGFPRRRGGGGGLRDRTRALLTTRPQLAALGAAASLLIALIVVLGTSNGDSLDGTHGSGSSAAPEVGAESRAAGGSTAAAAGTGASTAPATGANELAPTTATQKTAPGIAADSAASVPPVTPSPGGFVGGRNRRVERSASLVLAPSKEELAKVGDHVIAVTDRYRGIVLRSSITSTAGEGSTGSFDLRIPVRNLQPALRDLSALANVKSRSEDSDDVTASFVSARTRLQEVQAERRGLLRRLERAPTDQAAAAIRARIRIVNAQIEGQLSALNELSRRTSYAAVSVSLEAGEDSGGSGGIGPGARDLRDSLIDAANLSLRVLGVALPIGLVLGLMWLIGGRLSRRRREAVLD